MTTFSIKAGLTAAIATALIASPAMAGTGPQGESVSVRYSDLDLSTQEGQSVLQRRLNRAAEEVCGIDYRTSGRALPTTEARSCYAETIKNFEREIAVRAEEQQRG